MQEPRVWPSEVWTKEDQSEIIREVVINAFEDRAEGLKFIQNVQEFDSLYHDMSNVTEYVTYGGIQKSEKKK